ncbi:hypothetical protein I2W78_01360 [Streptomyces spinoverrucosus]|uniref:hypothetical protein n=1 Tax=Streptomyces spinoverrucosus TaxID=284043 RepID=UPI0018C36800|nr:hypothetical protein [Streptomyces spinoverrucosus]MBG0850536.1 hypothetical protein [Streptomyces spinoverrucosus]
MADATENEARARLLLRRAKRGRRWFVVPAVARQGKAAERELRESALAGDMAALRALAGPGPRPDRRFNQVWHDLVGARRDTSAALFDHLFRSLGYPVNRQGSHLSDDLALLVLRPGEDDLTEDMRPVLAVAAALGGHPLADIARRKILASGDQGVIEDVCLLACGVPELADFCMRHELSPTNPVRLATFWLLTGHYERYRAADPDGSLTVRAYALLDSTARARFRSAAIEGGLFGLVRRMAQSQGEFVDLLRGEQFAELSAGLARHGRWGRLWELVTEAPVVEAVVQARRFPEHWRPGSEADHRLYTELRSVSVELIAAAAADPLLLGTIRFEYDVLRLGLGRARAAVFSRTADQRAAPALDVYALPGGELLSHRTYEDDTVPGLAVPCGDEEATVVAGGEAGLWHFTPEDRILLDPSPVRDLVATAEGWAALSASQLLISTAHGRSWRRVGLTGLGLRSSAGLFAVSADGTRLAVADHRRAWSWTRKAGSSARRPSTRRTPRGPTPCGPLASSATR